nr:unnamed protein product [Spirometra erinaceieuropaei]
MRHLRVGAPGLVRQSQADVHQTIVGALRQTGQSSHDVVRDVKGDARVPRSALGRPLQKKTQPAPTFSSRPSPEHRVSLRAMMSTLKRATSAVFRSGRFLIELSRMGRTFKASRFRNARPSSVTNVQIVETTLCKSRPKRDVYFVRRKNHSRIMSSRPFQGTAYRSALRQIP